MSLYGWNFEFMDVDLMLVHISCSEAVCLSQMVPNWILTNLIAIHLGIPWR